MTTPSQKRLQAALDSGLKFVEITIQHTDLTAAATSQSFDVGDRIPDGAIAFGYDVNVLTGFAGLTTPTIESGRQAGTTNQFLSALTIAGIARTSQQIAATNTDPKNDIVTVTITAVNNVNNASAGTLRFRLYYFDAEAVRSN